MVLVNNNGFQGVLHNWDIDDRKNTEKFWEDEQRRLLDELDDDDRKGGRRPALKHDRDRGDDR